MGNDIEIRVRVANNTAAGLTAVNNSLRRLRDEAQDAGRGLDGLTARAAAATVALRALKDAAQDASRALRSLNTAARNADGRLSTMSDRSRTLRSDTDDLDASMRRLTTTMGGLRGGAGSVSLNASGNSMNGLRKAALMLSPALIPVAASLVPIAAGAGAATIAVGAFAAAVVGQISVAQSAADAQGKYTSAVAAHGPASEEAAKAEAEWLKSVRQMDPATRKAGAALQVFNDAARQWSKDLAGDTMPVFTKGMAALGGLLPQMAPLVRSTSTELNRLMTILAGGVNSSGFSDFMASFSEFASGALRKATDGLVRFMRTMSEGTGSSQLTEFMKYAREVGPQVGETLSNLARALTHFMAAASDVGVSLLTVVNSFAKLVNAIPTDMLGNLLQFVVVFKAVKVAALGLGGAGGAVSGFVASLAAMRAASAAAGGGLTGLAAAFGTLSRASKVALIGSGIGLLVVALSSLAEIGKKAPPDIDKMTTSLGEFALTGEMSGEAARVLGTDMKSLADAVRGLERPSNLESLQQTLTSLIGMDSTPVKGWKETLDGLDKGLADLVKGGNAELAEAFLKRAPKYMKENGLTTKELTKNLDDYKAALADQAFAAQLAADAQGLFGQQALAVQTKLDAQKSSADGLRQSIEALNDVNRNALGGMIGFEASIDAAAKAARENAGSLSMVNGHLDVNSPKAQAAATALNDLATKTKEAALANREATGSWEGAIGIYERGRREFIKSAEAMGLTEAEATALAESILNIPDEVSTLVKMNKEDAQVSLEAFNSAVQATPGAKSVTLKTLSKGAESILEAFGMKVERLPDGSVTVTTKAGGALSTIANVSGAIAGLDGQTATTYVKTVYFKTASGRIHESYAVGGRVRGYAGGGDVQAYPDGGFVQGPGSGTSDSILTMLGSGNVVRTSNTEFIVNARSTRKYLPLLEAINSNRLRIPGFAGGGLTKGQMKGLSAPSDLSALYATLSEVRTRIKERTSGRTESRLLRTLDSVGKKLVGHEKALSGVNKALEGAKSKLNDLKTASAQLASSVKGTILGEANIPRLATGENSRLTINTILSQMTGSAQNAGEFDRALKTLKKRGLSSALLQQIAEAGVTGGGLETAQALLGASAGQLKTLNDLQGQLTKSATSAGAVTADAVYGAEIKKQTDAVNRLQKSQDRLEKTMASLASALNKAIIRATGKASGGIVGMAASGGIRSNRTWVGEHGPELLDLPAGSRVWSNPDSRRMVQAPWASMLNTPRRGPAPAQAPAPGDARSGRPIVVQIEIGGRKFGEVIIDPLREAIHHRGGNVQATLGKGGG